METLALFGCKTSMTNCLLANNGLEITFLVLMVTASLIVDLGCDRIKRCEILADNFLLTKSEGV